MVRISLNERDRMFLKENNFCIDYSKAYTDNEYLKILDALYSAEAYFVGVDEKKS